MAKIDTQRTRRHLNEFNFADLFVEELGWSRPPTTRPERSSAGGVEYTRRRVAELGGVVVMEVAAEGGIPDAKARRAIHTEISKLHHENLLIFVDQPGDGATQSLWYWVKREDGKRFPREHTYFRGQPGDLFLARLSGLFVDLGDFDEEGNVPVVRVAQRLRDSLDVERVTRKFYRDFQEQHDFLLDLIEGISDERERRWYASVVLNRLMFIYFLQEKFFLDGGTRRYLQKKLEEAEGKGGYWYYDVFLRALFFEGFAKPAAQRSAGARALLGEIPYLNGGLFLPHRLEEEREIRIPDKAFEKLLTLFAGYTWNLNDTPGGRDDEINPDVLGYIFEKYINQKAFGAYYTRTEITEYLCEQTIHRLILQKVEHPEIPGAVARRFDSLSELLLRLDAPLCRELLETVLPELSVLDPACGSGAFLVAAMKTLIDVYSAVIGRIKFLNDRHLSAWLEKREAEHPSLNYFVKKQIISSNLFGVDVMEEATEIARLRLFLALVSSVERADQLEPLPNIDFNILAGNSLIGLLQVDEKAFDERQSQGNLFFKPYSELVREKDRLVKAYREAAMTEEPDSAALHDLREEIEEHRREANHHLNEMLLDEFSRLGIRFEQATWDAAKEKEGKTKNRGLVLKDIEDLQPFHWAYEFHGVLVERRGFDVIIANPPWDVFQADEKEFFQEFLPSIQKKKLRIEEWKEQHSEIMRNPEMRSLWLRYVSTFPHVAAYFKRVPHFANQRSTTDDGKAIPSKINLYTYFVEQCVNLLRMRGECGIVVPSGIYTDMSAKQLRRLLYEETQISGLFGFENRKEIFEGVHRSFKFVVLTFEKGGSTARFPAAFMRLDVADLEGFPERGALWLRTDLIRRLSPNTLSLLEFRSERDVKITEKLHEHPLLGADVQDRWRLHLAHGFNMTTDSRLFKTTPAAGRTPLFEGKMIHQFTHLWSTPRYWVSVEEGRARLLGKQEDRGQVLYFEDYYFAYRRIGRNTDERTLISTVLPPNVFASDSLAVSTRHSLGRAELLYLTAVLNSFVVDYALRQRVSANVNMFYLYQLPVPRLTVADPKFDKLARIAARLICTTPEFDDLAADLELGSHAAGAGDPADRARLRAELDGLVAHLYGLTEDEFTHVLSTFPLVPQQTKEAALAAYRALAPHPGDAQLEKLIAQGEGPFLEFKVAARWNPHRNEKDGTMSENVVQEVAAFLNSPEGGAVLLGVEDDGTVRGLADDFKAADPNKPNRDGYELFLRNLLSSRLGSHNVALCEISFHDVSGAEICRIRVPAAPQAVYLDGDLYIRSGNQKRKLSARDAIEYVKQRWPS